MLTTLKYLFTEDEDEVFHVNPSWTPDDNGLFSCSGEGFPSGHIALSVVQVVGCIFNVPYVYFNTYSRKETSLKPWWAKDLSANQKLVYLRHKEALDRTSKKLSTFKATYTTPEIDELCNLLKCLT